MIDPPRLLLASASPRRRLLLARLGLPFDVASVDIPETPAAGESPEQTARRLAILKLLAAVAAHPGRLALTADTVVDLGGVALGKPRSEADAVEMLRSLRGREHRVHTAVCVGAGAEPRVVLRTTRVWMRPYTDEEILRSVASGEPMDKAGAYAIQDETFRPVARLEGSYTNVVGLPLEGTARLLRDAGLPVPDPPREEPV